MKNILFTYLISILSSTVLMAQDCTGYHQYHCTYADYTFFYSRQSKSALFKRGQTSEMKIVTYANEDYYVGVCAHRKFGQIGFRILDDSPARNVIYDNSKDEHAESIIFSNETSRNLIIEVSVTPANNNDTDRRCVGVIVMFRKDE